MIKKLSIILLVLIVLAFSSITYAGFVGPGAQLSLSTVASINNIQNDDKVTLEGYIVKEIRSEHYIFKDATGEIEVEIDDEDFRGIKVTPETKVRLVGEVDKDRTSTTIDVDSVETVK
jgi:uncharacterized protein (TIGR00156 family)